MGCYKEENAVFEKYHKIQNTQYSFIGNIPVEGPLDPVCTELAQALKSLQSIKKHRTERNSYKEKEVCVVINIPWEPNGHAYLCSQWTIVYKVQHSTQKACITIKHDRVSLFEQDIWTGD